jgi:hypothetical protein
MSSDAELMLIFGVLHLVAVGLGVTLFVMFLRSDPNRSKPPDEEDPGGGGNDRISRNPKNSPSGGIPLPDADPASMRLRTHERLADPSRRRPARRRVVEPGPVRRRVPQR